MAIRSVGDILTAFDEGRYHTQRFIKTAASQTGDGQWQDWAYTSGQPGYDARVGVARTFTPQIATGNDAIWFPSIESGMERHLIGMRWRTSNASGQANQSNVEGQLYDLLGVYPLIDGDTTDLQEMDNTLTLPRYSDGEGVQMVLVNHVAPSVSQEDFVIQYTNNLGNARTATGRAFAYGVNKACYSTQILGVSGPLYIALDARCRGVRSVQSIQFTSGAPSGLWAIYLVKPIELIANRSGTSNETNPVMTEKCLCAESGFRLPRIYDGAHLGFFYMPQGGSRTISTVFGSLTFIWG